MASEKAKAALASPNPFRQNSPNMPFDLTNSITLSASRLSLAQPVQQTPKKRTGKPRRRNRKNNAKERINKAPVTVMATDESMGNNLKKETNILLLGQSGVGKSTFLNSFANYLQFGENFSKAEKGLRVMITASYEISYDCEEGGYNEPLKVLLQPEGGDDGNEVLGSGESATQEARCYTFQYEYKSEKKIIRVIDTPGLLDTGGIEKDQQNMERILKCAKHFPTIQAIIFILKPDEARATHHLRYNLGELLARLHKDAAKNILFSFPRSDWISQPEALTSLRPFFNEINQKCGVTIDMKTSMYRFDNYGFLYLAAKKFAGFKEKGKERKVAMEKWKNSVKDIEKMLKTIATLPDYPIKRSLEINETKNCLKALAVPMADLTRQIMNSERNLAAKREKIRQLTAEHKNIEGHTTYEQHYFVRAPLDIPRVCCFAEGCCISYNETDKIPDICHDNCECYEGEEECKIFKNGICSKCNCPWDCHKRMTWELEKKTQVVASESAKNAESANLTERQKANEFIRKLEQQTTKNRKSLEQMQKNAIIFVSFLHQNSLKADNDSFGVYLDQCIELAKQNSDQKQHEDLARFKANYEVEKKLFESTGRTRSPVTYEEVTQKLEEMMKDPIISESFTRYREILGIDDEDSEPAENFQTLTTLFGKISS